MGRIFPLLVAFGLMATSGCMSTHVVKNKARPHVEYDAATERHKQVEGHTGYYALLPLTIPADVATYPLQLIFLGGGLSSSAQVTIDGWPVPLW